METVKDQMSGVAIVCQSTVESLSCLRGSIMMNLLCTICGASCWLGSYVSIN